MKRFILLSFGILISASLGMLVSGYTLAFTTTESVTERLFKEAGAGQHASASDPKELERMALAGDFPFQNLYLFMYQNVLDGPREAALKILSNQTINGMQFSEDELINITQKGDTTPILAKQEEASANAQDAETLRLQEAAQAGADAAFEQFLADNSSLPSSAASAIRSAYETRLRPQISDQEDVATQGVLNVVSTAYTSILEVYQKELDLQRDNRKLAYAALANEMFLNNDLSDSANIDLLYDLDLVHYILFDEYITYPDRSGGEAVELASLPMEPASLSKKILKNTPLNDVPDEAVVLSSETSDSNPYTCLDNTALSEALSVFEAEGSGATGAAPEDSGLVYFDVEEIVSEVSSDAATAAAASGAAEAVRQGVQEMEDFLVGISGNKGDWTRSLPCGDVFCITVELVDGNDDPVATGNLAPTDNCVACHIAYINQAMTATTDHSLVPGKVSKNWFEDATCKEAGNRINLDFNVYAIKKSIDLDPGDDIDSAPQKNIDDLKNTLIHLGAFPSKGAPGTVLGKKPEDLECESLLNLTQLTGSSQTVGDAQTQCEEAANQLQEELVAVYDQSQFEGMHGEQSTLYEQVAAELYKMALTFRNFQEQIQATYQGDSAPLPGLLAKPYCPQ